MTEALPLIQTKVHVPRVANLFTRERLQAFFREHIHRKLLLVCAGPGYGKTSLLVDFAHNTDSKVCWYTLDPFDRDPGVFLDYLVEAVRVHFPTFGEEVRRALRQGGSGNLRGVIGLFVNELTEQGEDVVIVLDEYHTVIGEAAINQTLDILVQYLPQNVHVVIASRSPPPIAIIPAVSHGAVAGIGTDALRFTEAEVKAVFGERFQLSDDLVHQLTEQSEGWITGILLCTQSMWQQVVGFLANLKGPAERVYSYMTREVLSYLPQEIREFLKGVSILSRLEPGLCDALLARRDSAEVLDFLRERNLFLVPLEAGWYRFHGLFQESLERELRCDAETFALLHRRAAQLWRERNESNEAVEHLLQAQAYAEAGEQIEILSDELFVRGQLQTLVQWIGRLPAPVVQERPRLLLSQAKAYSELGKREQALSLLQQAEQLLAEADDQEGWVQAKADMSMCHRLAGAYDEALRMAQETLPRAEDLKTPALVDLHRVVGACLLAKGKPREAEEHFRPAVAYSLESSSLYNQALAYQDLGVCLRMQGCMQEAEQAYEQSLARWQAIGNPASTANILNNLAMGPFLRGDFKRARELLQEALDSVDKSLSPYSQAVVRASLSDLYRDQGCLASSRQMCQDGLVLARQARSATLAAYLLESLGNLVRQQGAYAEARRYLEEALDAAASSRSDQARVQVSLALLETAEGHPLRAADTLAATESTIVEGGGRLQLMRIRLAKAIVTHHLGQSEEADAAFREAVSLAEAMGVVEPFLAEAIMLCPLLQGLPPETGDGFLYELHHRLEAQSIALKSASRSAASGEVQLRILALGKAQVFRSGTEIPVSAWEGPKPRELFFFLLFHAPVSKGQVGLEFWPDEDAKTVSGRFHTTLHSARRTLGDPHFVVFERGSYHWNREVTRWCDVEEFQNLVDQVGGLAPADPEASVLLEQAIALYRGDFLEEFDSDWCCVLREKLRDRYLQALLRLGSVHLGRQGFDSAADAFRKALDVDPLCEEACRGLMVCYDSTGERVRALDTFRQFRRRLSLEMGVLPSEATQALYQAIAREQPLPPVLPPHRGPE